MPLHKRFLLIGLLLLSGWVEAQSFSGGLTVGLTSNQVDGDGLGGFDHTGAQFGFYTRRDLSEHWSAQLDLIYLWKGAREPLSDTSNNYRADLHTISLPLLAQYHTGKWRFEAGFALDFTVLTREQDLYGDFESDPAYRRFAMSGAIGLYYHLTPSFAINSRFYYGFTPLRDGRIVRRPTGWGPDLITGQRAVTWAFGLCFEL